MKLLLDNIDKEFNNPANEYFYVLSTKWLEEWKRYTSYNEINEGNQPDETWFGQIPLGKINQDIAEQHTKVAKYPDEDDYRNVFLKCQIQEKKDYELVTETTWTYLAKRYENIPVQRYAYTGINGKRYVEVALKLIKLVPVNHNFLKHVDHKRVQEFKLCLVQASSQTTLKDFKSDLAKIANLKANKHWYEAISFYMDPFEVTEENLRLWKLDPALSLKEFYQRVKGILYTHSSYNYQIEFKGQFIDKESKETKLEETQIAADDYVFLEAKDSSMRWNFYGDGIPPYAKCEYCMKYEELSFPCSCNKVAYCTQDCKRNDRKFHKARCAMAEKEEQ